MTRADQRHEGYGEAGVPDTMSPEESRHTTFIDTSRLRSPEELTGLFGYQSEIKPFGLKEQLLFAVAFKDSPKDFFKIATVLPGRTMRDCVQHYYGNKFDGRFKIVTTNESLRKAVGGGKDTTHSEETSLAQVGRLRSQVHRSSHSQADPLRPAALKTEVFTESYLKRNWNSDTPPIDQEIIKLKAVTTGSHKLWHKAFPLVAMKPVIVIRTDLVLLRPSFEEPLFQSDEQLLSWLRSADVLPVMKQWKTECLENAEIYRNLQRALPSTLYPWDLQARQVGYYARTLQDRDFQSGGGDALRRCAGYAKKIVRGNTHMFEQFSPYGFSDSERHLAAARVLLTAYNDLTKHGLSGFFGILLSSELAGIVKADVRKAWERKYPFEGEVLEEPKMAKKRAGKSQATDKDESGEDETLNEVLMSSVKAANTDLSRKGQGLAAEKARQAEALEEQDEEIVTLKSELAAYQNRYG